MPKTKTHTKNKKTEKNKKIEKIKKTEKNKKKAVVKKEKSKKTSSDNNVDLKTKKTFLVRIKTFFGKIFAKKTEKKKEKKESKKAVNNPDKKHTIKKFFVGIKNKIGNILGFIVGILWLFFAKCFEIITIISKFFYNSVLKKCARSVWNMTKGAFYASVKIGLSFSDKAQCSECKTINTPVSHVWKFIANGYNNVKRPAPDFGNKINSYKCKTCKKEFTKKIPKKEAYCPHCGSKEKLLVTDGDKDYVDNSFTTYENVKVRVGIFKSYPWCERSIDLHQIYKCPKCNIELWQFISVSKSACCPYCHAIGNAEKRVYVEDVSTYHKSEVVAHRERYLGNSMVKQEPIYGEVAYEHGYETTEYYCSHCGEIVYRAGHWYDRKL